jgi:hypothetical protein
MEEEKGFRELGRDLQDPSINEYALGLLIGGPCVRESVPVSQMTWL